MVEDLEKLPNNVTTDSQGVKRYVKYEGSGSDCWIWPRSSYYFSSIFISTITVLNLFRFLEL